MVVLQKLHSVGEAERHRQLDLILVLVLAVAAALFGLPVLHRRQALLARNLLDIVGDAVFIAEGFLGKAAVLLLDPQQKLKPLVDHRLLFQRVAEVVHRDGNVGKDLEVRLPALAGTGLLLLGRFLVQAADVFPFFKVESVSEAVPDNLRVKIFGGVLGGAGTEAV